ncbi:MAG: flagellar P-ring protein precursor FlgI [Planctomycetota bacterium]|jgi:flagellar P-ring protein precursor FlgI
MTLLPAFLLALAPIQGPGPAGGEPAVIWVPAAVEAPAQPTGRSSSRYVKLPRRRIRGVTGITSTRMRAPVNSIMRVRGRENNVVSGFGLVTGLANTGDTGEAALRMARNIVVAHGLPVDLSDLSGNNLAFVSVRAEIPAGSKPGTPVSANVSTMGDAKSLLGGQLMFTELFDTQMENVYATASGAITVGGINASGEGASSTKNHTTVGTLPSGAKIEREIPSVIVNESGFLYLDAKIGQDTLSNMVASKEAINKLFPGVARILPDGKSLRVGVPSDLHVDDHLMFLDAILRLEVETESIARVVINERTGIVVMGGDVRLRPGLVAAGAITVTIAETPEASQPAPFSEGTTQILSRTDLVVTEENRALTMLPQAATLNEVMEVLNVLGATPRELISILTALSEAGLLVADIQRM